MAGQVNSWMEQINISPVPCIGDTVRKTSSSDVYAASGDGMTFDGDNTFEESPLQSASLWWLIGAGLLIGLLARGSKRRTV